MKLLLLAGLAVLTLLVAAGDKIGPPVAGAEVAWTATAPIHSPR